MLCAESGERDFNLCVRCPGPQGAWEDHFHFRWNLAVFAGAGFVVFAPNVHGVPAPPVLCSLEAVAEETCRQHWVRSGVHGRGVRRLGRQAV
jgi:hypothetical protein